MAFLGASFFFAAPPPNQPIPQPDIFADSQGFLERGLELKRTWRKSRGSVLLWLSACEGVDRSARGRRGALRNGRTLVNVGGRRASGDQAWKAESKTSEVKTRADSLLPGAVRRVEEGEIWEPGRSVHVRGDDGGMVKHKEAR